MSEADLIRKSISEISNELMGHMSNLERALLVEDRKDLRARLRQIEEREARHQQVQD